MIWLCDQGVVISHRFTTYERAYDLNATVTLAFNTEQLTRAQKTFSVPLVTVALDFFLENLDVIKLLRY